MALTARLSISIDSRVGLAHRCLAVIDLRDSGTRPMATADGRLRIALNVEICNYRELRREFSGKSFVSGTNGDTELLLHPYADRRR